MHVVTIRQRNNQIQPAGSTAVTRCASLSSAALTDLAVLLSHLQLCFYFIRVSLRGCCWFIHQIQPADSPLQDHRARSLRHKSLTSFTLSVSSSSLCPVQAHNAYLSSSTLIFVFVPPVPPLSYILIFFPSKLKVSSLSFRLDRRVLRGLKELVLRLPVVPQY